MFLKYRILRYVKKHGSVEERLLAKKFGSLSRVNTWCDPSSDLLKYFSEGRLSPGAPASYEITEQGLEYIESISRELFLLFLGAFLGFALAALLGVIQKLAA